MRLRRRRAPAQPVRADVYARVGAPLEAWAGYRLLSKLMRADPALQVFLAGGAVRDALLQTGQPQRDFDFFVDGPDARAFLAALQAGGTLTYGPFGSPRWFPEGEDSYVDVIFIRDFYNGVSRCRNMVDVLHQFDFTANALAVDLRSGEFLDPVGGLRDLERRVMRAVRFDYPDEPIAPGKAITRLSVLWFRLLHYAALRKLRIEPVTMKWLLAHRKYQRDLPVFRKLFFEPHPRALPLREASP